jgi:hypothetical protein
MIGMERLAFGTWFVGIEGAGVLDDRPADRELPCS